MRTAAVFIDGGYLNSLLRDFDYAAIDMPAFVRWAAEGYEVYRAYYYDCLPYQGTPPTPEEKERFAKKQRYLDALNRYDRFSVRLGRLRYRGTDDDGAPIFQQKRVDLMLGLDIATVVTKARVDMVALVTGDSDMVPAVEKAKQEGPLVRLVHGELGRYAQDLWDEADERREITRDVVRQLYSPEHAQRRRRPPKRAASPR